MKTITRVQAIHALNAMWDIAFPENSHGRVQDWAEGLDLCDMWDGDEDYTDDMKPPGIWDLLLSLGVTPAELIEHCHANPALFESPTLETKVACSFFTPYPGDPGACAVCNQPSEKHSDARRVDILARAGCTCPVAETWEGKHREGCPAAPGECFCRSCNTFRVEPHSGLPWNSTRMTVCPECGNKRCPKAELHTNACTNSNEPGQLGSSL
jgi:hypothetical protein